MRAGRFFCVAFPIILTIGAIISFMVAILSGVAHNSLYMFRINLEDLSLDEANIQDIVGNLNIDLGGFTRRADISVTAGDLGLGNKYDVTLWGYCEVKDDGRDCTKAEFNWASKRLGDDVIGELTGVKGTNIDLPEEIDTALDIFSTVTRYTEIAFIVALAVLGAELVFGIFANCTRVLSCLTWLIGIAAIVFCVVAAGLATAMAAVVVGAVEATAEQYGVHGSVNTNFLVCVWIGAAFAIAASLFWLFTICCCKPDHNRRDKRRGSIDSEKMAPTGAYYPIGNDHEMSNTGYHNQFQPTYGQDYSHAPSYNSSSRSDLGYEPYAHRA